MRLVRRSFKVRCVAVAQENLPAIIRFEDDVRLGYDPLELLLPTEIDEQGIAYFEIRTCKQCEQFFPLTADECDADEEPTACPACAS